MNKVLLSLAMPGAGLISLLMASCVGSSKSQKPNIMLIMTDDMGYSDIGRFGSEITTPNLDRLTEQGLRMTQ